VIDITKTTQETTQEKILRLIKKDPFLTGSQIAQLINLTSDSIKYHIDQLVKKGSYSILEKPKKGIGK